MRGARDDRRSRGVALRQGTQKRARICHLGHLLTENLRTLVDDVELTKADGFA